jgi:hypothetical protein
MDLAQIETVPRHSLTQSYCVLSAAILSIQTSPSDALPTTWSQHHVTSKSLLLLEFNLLPPRTTHLTTPAAHGTHHHTAIATPPHLVHPVL